MRSSAKARNGLPNDEYSTEWEVVVDTAGEMADDAPLKARATVTVAEKTLVVLREFTTPEPEADHSVAASLASLADSQVPTSSPRPISN